MSSSSSSNPFNLQHLLLLRHAQPDPLTPPPAPTTPTATRPTIAFGVLKPKPARKRPDPITTAAGSAGIIPPCTECGKRFSSWKALFGHMRCHPERQWRGINPPAHFRRGPQSPSFSSEEYEVATALVSLANGALRRDEGGGPHGTRPEHRCSHKCSVCWRGFSSGQALGGHMRCHWDTNNNTNHNHHHHSDDYDSNNNNDCTRDFVLDLNMPPAPPPPPLRITSGVDDDDDDDDGVLDLRLGV